MTFVGLDLHKRYITACALAAFAAPVTVGMEATSHIRGEGKEGG